MSDFYKSGIRSFSDELQALIDYGHDCCARIDDKIHEHCQRIREAHEREIGAFELALGWKEDQLDSVHANLERELSLAKADAKTQRNNFDQATSAREHWKKLYEQSLEQIHDLEHDVEMWRDRTEDMRMERDDALKEHHAWAPESHYMMLPKDADGEPIHEHDKVDWRDHAGTWHENATVVAVCNDGCYVMDGTVFHVHKSDIRHHHAPTVEDVLREFICDHEEGVRDEVDLIAEYATKLRLAGDAE